MKISFGNVVKSILNRFHYFGIIEKEFCYSEKIGKPKNYFPISVSKYIAPCTDSMMFSEMAKPNPVPEDLVVKLGTKTFSRISLEIPVPLSEILTIALPSKGVLLFRKDRKT